jgi:hypothetical protein
MAVIIHGSKVSLGVIYLKVLLARSQRKVAESCLLALLYPFFTRKISRTIVRVCIKLFSGSVTKIYRHMPVFGIIIEWHSLYMKPLPYTLLHRTSSVTHGLSQKETFRITGDNETPFMPNKLALKLSPEISKRGGMHQNCCYAYVSLLNCSLT